MRMLDEIHIDINIPEDFSKTDRIQIRNNLADYQLDIELAVKEIVCRDLPSKIAAEVQVEMNF